MEQIKRFVEEFFCNLKCDVSWSGDFLEVSGVPKSFEDLFGKSGPYRICFDVEAEGCLLASKGSLLFGAMTKYLEGAGKATILRIDFDVDPEVEIKKRLALSNCELSSLTRSYRNSFFSRFSFVSTFSYLNESEKLLSEVYVHRGKWVSGDLSGYSVVDGESLKLDGEKVRRDYEVAKERVGELIRGKQSEISEVLGKKVEDEVLRIRKHYDKTLGELGSDLKERLDKVREIELEIRGTEGEEREVLRKRLSRLKAGLIKAGDDGAMERVLKEREMTIRDAMHKYSLNVSRKLVNTTVIYYPVYTFKLHLNVVGDKSGAGRLVDVSYDPLLKSFSGLECEGCGEGLARVSLCSGGHICCRKCLDRCGECGGSFCVKCLRRGCRVCGRKLCKGCVRTCLKCGSVVCASHLRKDCVSGEERCVGCLRACLRCRGLSEEKFFGVSRDGSKVCFKCLGRERVESRLGI